MEIIKDIGARTAYLLAAIALLFSLPWLLTLFETILTAAIVPTLENLTKIGEK